jgi:hypothetical protein
MTDIAKELHSIASDLEAAASRLGLEHEEVMSKIFKLQSKVSQAQAAKVVDDEQLYADAARYRWIRAQRNFELHTCRTYGVPWTNMETGKRYYPTHYLAVNGTGFGGIEKLDDLIDQAMELYPIKGQ